MDNYIKKLESIPGRFSQTISDASFDAWIKHYRPNENSINSNISYVDIISKLSDDGCLSSVVLLIILLEIDKMN